MQLVDDVLKSLDNRLPYRAMSAATRRGEGKMAARHQGTLNRPNPLPREVAPGIFWLGECWSSASRARSITAATPRS